MPRTLRGRREAAAGVLTLRRLGPIRFGAMTHWDSFRRFSFLIQGANPRSHLCTNPI